MRDADPAIAVHWFERAAELGNAEVQVNLPISLEAGRGIERDDARGRMAARGIHYLS